LLHGYGVNGQNLARAAKTAAIPHLVVELDPEVMEQCRRDGVPVVFGDAAAEEVLAHLAVPNAGVVVIAISDPEATRRILHAIRHINLTAYIVVRTRYVKEVQSLLNMGADEVIPEEFETSIEIFTRVLMHYLVPKNDIEELTEKIREGNYSMLRDTTGAVAGSRKPLPIPDMEVIVLRVNRTRAKLVGKTIGEIGFRSNHGVGLLAVQRGQRFYTRLEDELTLEFDDQLYIAGNAAQVARLNKFLIA
jgi:CPA2 family monovalent cation:H+ antiporter-2